MKRSSVFAVIVFIAASNPAYSLDSSVSQLVAGKTTVIKFSENGLDLTKDYSVSSSDVTVVEMGGKIALIGREAGVKQITATKKTNASEKHNFSVEVKPGTAAKLVVESGHLQKGVILQYLPNPVKVKAVDYYNNGVSGVEVDLTSSSSSSELSAQKVITGPNGVAEFTYKLGEKAGIEFVYAKSSKALTRSSSKRFDFIALAEAESEAKKLIFDSIPSDVVENSNIPISIQVKDGAGTPYIPSKEIRIASYKNSSCSIAVDAISGEVVKNSANGIASFEGMSFKTSGYFYLGASVAGLPIACSKQIQVKAKVAVGPSSIVFNNLTNSVLERSPFSPNISVYLLNSKGYLSNVPSSVTLTAHSESSCGQASVVPLTGATVVNSIFGRATFSKISVSAPQTIYIKAVSGAASVCSPSIIVQPKISNSTSCPAGQHLETGKCISDVQVCAVSGGDGEKTYVNGVWGQCILKTCNNNYVKYGNSCVPASCTTSDIEFSTIVKGDKVSGCSPVACKHHLVPSNGQCVAPISTIQLDRDFRFSNELPYEHFSGVPYSFGENGINADISNGGSLAFDRYGFVDISTIPGYEPGREVELSLIFNQRPSPKIKLIAQSYSSQAQSESLYSDATPTGDGRWVVKTLHDPSNLNSSVASFLFYGNQTTDSVNLGLVGYRIDGPHLNCDVVNRVEKRKAFVSDGGPYSRLVQFSRSNTPGPNSMTIEEFASIKKHDVVSFNGFSTTISTIMHDKYPGGSEFFTFFLNDAPYSSNAEITIRRPRSSSCSPLPAEPVTEVPYIVDFSQYQPIPANQMMGFVFTGMGYVNFEPSDGNMDGLIFFDVPYQIKQNDGTGFKYRIRISYYNKFNTQLRLDFGWSSPHYVSSGYNNDGTQYDEYLSEGAGAENVSSFAMSVMEGYVGFPPTFELSKIEISPY